MRRREMGLNYRRGCHSDSNGNDTTGKEQRKACTLFQLDNKSEGNHLITIWDKIESEKGRITCNAGSIFSRPERLR